MADYDCDFCSCVEKCKRQYEELDCPYNAVKTYSKEECEKLFDKADEIMKAIDEFRLIDNEGIFEDIVESFRWQLEWEIKDLVTYDTIEELELMKDELKKEKKNATN